MESGEDEIAGPASNTSVSYSLDSSSACRPPRGALAIVFPRHEQRAIGADGPTQQYDEATAHATCRSVIARKAQIQRRFFPMLKIRHFEDTKPTV